MTNQLEKIYVKKGEFVDKNDKVIKKIHQVFSTAFTSTSKEELINTNGNEKEIIENFIKKNSQCQEANAYLVGSNMEHKDECSIMLPVTFFTITKRKEKK